MPTIKEMINHIASTAQRDKEKGHNRACVGCLMVSKTDLQSQYITECSLDIYINFKNISLINKLHNV